MKTQLLSIFSEATKQNPAADLPTESVNSLARYYDFLNQQNRQQSAPKSNVTGGAFRLAQALFSLAIFVVVFLATLTLFGIGLSRLGVIAQVSPAKTPASSRQSNPPTKPGSQKVRERK
ncbi:MAG: hypothetical protein ACKVZH_19275 [Blastocatellia bacterium]